MSQSLYTAMGGIAAAQTQLNVVSNNIANVNTIGFKESNVTFQDIFSTTLTAGNAPTVTTGGKNPVQIGLGVQVGTISKNFDSGTWSATGKSTDIMIQGNGFFTVQSSDGKVFLTKAGNFSFDASGDLVNAQGYKVLGSGQVFGNAGSTSNVNVPQKMVTNVQANTDFYNKALTALNGCQLTAGTFTMNTFSPTGTAVGSVEIALDTKTDSSMKAITNSINTQITNSATHKGNEAGFYNTANTLLAAGGAITDPAVVSALASAKVERLAAGDKTDSPVVTNAATALTAKNAATAAATSLTNSKCICDDSTNGTVQFKVDGTNTGSLSFVPGTSNFVLATQLASAKIDATTHTYTSKTLDWMTKITPVVSLDNAVSVSNYTIAEDGSIEATYSNGDKLTIETNPSDNTFQFKYTTSTGVIIRGNDVNVNPNVAIPSNLQVQLSNVINPEGLVAVGGNLYMPGPNTGDMIFTVGGTMGVGALKSGGLEASNVDISKQFSDMILAQRAVQANSRVFTTTSDIMQTLVQLGR